MPAHVNISPRTRARKLVSAALMGIVLAMVGLGALLIRHSLGSPAANAYELEIEDARQSGIPASTQALQAPLPPPEQNAASLYTQLTDTLASHPLSQQDKIIDSLTAMQTPSKEQFERVRRALKHRSELLTLIHQATTRPQCVFTKDWSNPNSVTMKEIAPMREAARLLVAKSALLAHDGKPLDAVRNQAQGFRIARHVENENYMLGHMTAVAIDGMTLRGLQKILYAEGGNPAVADAVRSVIEKEWRPHSLSRAFQNQAGAQVVDLQNLRMLGPAYLNQFMGDNSSPPMHMNPQQWNAFIDDNGRALLKQERKVIAAADLPYLQSVLALREAASEIENDNNHTHVLDLMLSIDYGNLAERQAGNKAQVEVTRTAAALLSWKARHGSFPPTLTSALSPLPLDPFDGKPLRYRREGSGFVLFSVGKDTGGAPTKKPGNFEYRYPLPPFYAGPITEN